jgi:Protein of unknown function (DUF3237)
MDLTLSCPGDLSGVTQPPSPPPRLSLAMEIHVRVGPPLEIGDVPAGRRRIVPILGGTFEGPSLKGRVLAGGADWQVIQRDGLAVLEARYTLETDQEQLIYIQNAGLRRAPPDITARLLAGQDVDPELVYFRTIPRFERSLWAPLNVTRRTS